VAVKILKSRKDQDSIKRLLVEGESIQKINTTHPESPVVKVNEFGREKTTGQYYIAMDYLGGQNLKQILQSDVHIGLNYKLFIIKEVAKALRDSHALDIYHRDISPENIIIDHKRKKVTLIDFGIASQSTSRIQTIPNMILGTLAYASPEQCSGGTITGKSDIYSLGAVFFYMLEGKPPFYSLNVYELIVSHRLQPVPEMKAPVPKELKQFIYSMLAKQPDERPDANEVIEKMREFLENFKGS
jgi:serine/threonine-protein kinase